MLVSELELQLSDDHEGIIDLPADAPVGAHLRRLGRARRPGDRDQPHAQPRRLHRRARHRARPRRRRHGQVQGPADQAGEGRVPLPGQGHARLRRRRRRSARPSRCGWCAASRTARRRTGCSAADARSGCARSTRWSTSPTSSPTTAAGRCTCSTPPRCTGNLTVRRARAGETLLALDGKTYTLDDDDLRHRRRERRRVARRHHGRRGVRLLGDDHRRADRIGAVGAAQHRADRPQARHQFRRALSLRARRRSGLHGAGAGARDPAWCSTSAAASRRTITVAGKAEAPETHHRFPARASCKRLAGLDVGLPEIKRVLGASRLLRRRPGRQT